MVEKCKNCGESQVKFPIKGQPEKTLAENFLEKTIRWKNLFKMEWRDVIMILIIVGMTSSYILDTKNCRDVIEHPVESCERIGCDCIKEVPNGTSLFYEPINLTVINGGKYA